MLTLETCRG